VANNEQKRRRTKKKKTETLLLSTHQTSNTLKSTGKTTRATISSGGLGRERSKNQDGRNGPC